MESKWISGNKKPKESKKRDALVVFYLGYDDTIKEYSLVYYDKYYTMSNKFWRDENGNEANVTHYMPLPEPPIS